VTTENSCRRFTIGAFGRLVDQGNSVIVIERNLDVIKTAAWVVDMVPRAARAVAPGAPPRAPCGPRPPRADVSARSAIGTPSGTTSRRVAVLLLGSSSRSRPLVAPAAALRSRA
jgi:hypothetical protein